MTGLLFDPDESNLLFSQQRFVILIDANRIAFFFKDRNKEVRIYDITSFLEQTFNERVYIVGLLTYFLLLKSGLAKKFSSSWQKLDCNPLRKRVQKIFSF